MTPTTGSRALLLLFLVTLIFPTTTLAKKVTIDNLKPRYDIHGQIIDAHDGSIQKFSKDGLYYVHAMQYGLCKEPTRYGCDMTPERCGFQLDHNISIFSSPDLSSGSWTYVGNSILVKDRPAGVVFRPHAIFNPNTKLYVLWWNWQSQLGQFFAAAVSSKPEGPFGLVVDAVNVSRKEGGDFDLFIDDDGKGYVIYSWDFVIHIEELTQDLLHSTGRMSKIFPEYFVEAPVMFKRNGIYYAIFGHCCCYCEQGSGLFVHTSSSPLGPYIPQPGGNIACIPNSHFSGELLPTPGQGCQYQNPSTTSVTRSQQNFVIQVDTPNGIEYVYTGDRWQQSPDGLKGHDPQFWVPLKFNQDGSIQKITWVDEFELDVL
eukprot:TRINITY_DN1640_c0_g2_i1.p1 TRINITY_DN1640_c0_g2~~TRINITY_DN1640_c0_g2_i1.p1  ORF type:complete len:372 (-),score=59.67 TRINITY_DN1640_c0_g2_i1:190-1305(-)